MYAGVTLHHLFTLAVLAVLSFLHHNSVHHPLTFVKSLGAVTAVNLSVLYGLYLCSNVAFVVHPLTHDLNIISLLNTAYNFNVPLVAHVLIFCPFVYTTVVPSWLVLHHANVHPLGAVHAYVLNALAVSYVCVVFAIPLIFVVHAVLLLFHW